MNPNKISNIHDAARLIDEWSNCLYKLREVFDFKRRGESLHCRWDRADVSGGSSWYGTYGSGWAPYAGFEIEHKSGKVFCSYQCKVSGAFPENLYRQILREKARLRFLSDVEWKRGKFIWLAFKGEYPRPQGRVGDKVLDVFRTMKQEAEAVRKLLCKGRAASKRGR